MFNRSLAYFVQILNHREIYVHNTLFLTTDIKINTSIVISDSSKGAICLYLEILVLKKISLINKNRFCYFK